jgi:ceramide glucosyltransferase
MQQHDWLFILAVLAWLLALLPVPLTLRLRRYVQEYLPATGYGFVPRVALVLPCKGLDPGFRANIAALLSQDYDNCEFYFVTATEGDSAHAALTEMLAEYPERHTRLITAGIVEYRAQKLTNQLAAVRALSPEVEVLAFVDSDIRPRPDFLRNLIHPLRDPSVGASTGFRWYSPVKGGLASYLRATWNAGGLPFLIDDRLNFVWGGAMAIRRADYFGCGVDRAWDRALSDDFGLTHAVKKSGLGIRFVPSCLAVSHEDATLRQTLEWTNRQTTIARVYSPPFWLSVGLVHGGLNLFVLLGLVLLILAAMGHVDTFLPGLALLFPILLQWVNARLLLPAILPMLGNDASRVSADAWKYVSMAPLASTLALYNSIHAAFTRRITWRGITYEMASPNDTRIIQAETGRENG